MAVVYFDASAFVKLLIEENGSEIAADLWDGCDVATSSRLAYAEVHATLAAARRSHRLGESAIRTVNQNWAEYWAAVRPVELTHRIGDHAGDLVREHALRGADGVHLASALALAELDPVMAVWDKRLCLGAVGAGLRVAPAVDGSVA